MSRHLHIVWSVSAFHSNSTDGQRLRIEVDESIGVSPKVFAYLMQPLSSSDQTQRAQFDHICSPPDLEDYPEDSPVVHSIPAWFRLNYVDLLFRSQHELQQALADIKVDLGSLISTLNLMDYLGHGGEEWLNDNPTHAESDSLSGSSENSVGLP